MSLTIQRAEPSAFTAGETVKFSKTFADNRRADSWSVTYYLRGAFNLEATATASTNADDFLVTFSATDTAQLPAGNYRLTGRASLSGEVVTVYDGRVDVAANPATLGVGDETRSYWRQVLDAGKAALLQLAAQPERSVSILGRSYNFANLKELQDLVSNAQSFVDAEEAKAAMARGDSPKKNILARFR